MFPFFGSVRLRLWSTDLGFRVLFGQGFGLLLRGLAFRL